MIFLYMIWKLDGTKVPFVSTQMIVSKFDKLCGIICDLLCTYYKYMLMFYVQKFES